MREAAAPNSDAVAPQGGPLGLGPDAGGGSPVNTVKYPSAALAADAPPAAALPVADAVPPLGAPVSAGAGILAGNGDIRTIYLAIAYQSNNLNIRAVGNFQHRGRQTLNLFILSPVMQWLCILIMVRAQLHSSSHCDMNTHFLHVSDARRDNGILEALRVVECVCSRS